MVDAALFVKIIDLFREMHTVVIHHDQGVDCDPGTEHQIPAFNHPPPGTLPAAETAIAVMHLLGAIEGEADQKTVLVEEAGPVFIDVQAVGLQSVARLLTGAAAAALIVNSGLVKAEPHQRGLAPLPGKIDTLPPLLHHLADSIAQHRLAHPVRRAREKGRLVQIVTVMAGERAVRPGRLDEHRGERFHSAVT